MFDPRLGSFLFGHAGINRTDLGAFGGVVIAFTLHALCRVDEINRVAGSDSLDRALRFTQTTSRAILGNFICHFASLVHLALL
jgi:hypothetical protein